jgi:hypothetical protein
MRCITMIGSYNKSVKNKFIKIFKQMLVRVRITIYNISCNNYRRDAKRQLYTEIELMKGVREPVVVVVKGEPLE